MNTFYKYLPVTRAEEDWGFYVNTVGYTKINPRETYPPVEGHPATHAFTWNKGRILDGYYLVFISKGKGLFESRETPPTHLKEGTCFFLFPDIWHRYRPDMDSGWEEYWVGFKGRYPDSLMKTHFLHPEAPFVEVGLDESLLILFQRLLEIVQQAKPGYHQVISAVTLEMLALMHTATQHSRYSENPTRQLIQKAIFLLRESLDKAVHMEDLARELPMGYSKFRKQFKTVTGVSPHEYHLGLRIDKARELLRSTTLNVNEIAYHTGFESVYYFSRLFKKKTGLSPRHFRDRSTRHRGAAGRVAGDEPGPAA
jgi:AraC-like DNA-binding protein